MSPRNRHAFGVSLMVLAVFSFILFGGMMLKDRYLLNEPPEIVYFLPTNGAMFQMDDNYFVVFPKDDQELPSELHYDWQVSEGTFEPTDKPNAIIYHSPSAPGSYYVFVTVTVTDRWGAKATATTRILVTDRY